MIFQRCYELCQVIKVTCQAGHTDLKLNFKVEDIDHFTLVSGDGASRAECVFGLKLIGSFLCFNNKKMIHQFY